MVRSWDMFNQSPKEVQKSYAKEVGEEAAANTTLHFLPASFLHSSLRLPRIVFDDEGNEKAFAILVGTKYRKNWALRRYQRKGSVYCSSYFPLDAGTNMRGVLQDPSGTGCNPQVIYPLCLNNGTCMSGNTETGCGECQISGNAMGEFYS